MVNTMTWHDVLAEEKEQPYFRDTLAMVAAERASGKTIYPHKGCLQCFPPYRVRRSEGGDFGTGPLSWPQSGARAGLFRATGRCGAPSLVNIYKELVTDIRLRTPKPRLSRKLGAPGRHVAQHGADGGSRSGTFAC